MAKMYYMIFLVLVLLQIQTIFGAMNVTISDVEDNKLDKLNMGNSGSNSTSTITLICPANGICIERGDPNYIIPKSIGKERVENIFSDITKFDGFENNKKGLIVESCNKKRLQSNKCQTRKCAVNEDCFSGLCETSLGSCITNPNNMISECNLVDGEFQCSKYLQEECVMDAECAGRCKNFVCTYKYLNKLNTNPLLYYSSGIGILLFIILLFLCCCCCPGIFHWDVKEKRNNNNPRPVV
ncbi:hypothetical protein BCR32DRAFT_268200 [Anaeromyces robustus]|jgi:hypothetical protein|uniref:EB domain-containing protein n=1 Tax=Anaeromyces robustus TaxID=1754192 RepID=A0A1Y1X753_9FUNG|nr:hypothetical protein BCR32DRAFT_268200 [Anaeromyces robustus]|eukprot:ORX81613.1 hypothetical protein BCR32DRAFT_268200 [Anaeromyces robustus]